MNKILLILKREYINKVSKRSFIIMTLIGPLLLAGVMIVPTWLALNSSENHKILVIDQSSYFFRQLENGEKIKFDFVNMDLEQGKLLIEQSDYKGLLFVPKIEIDKPENIKFYSVKTPGIELKSYMERQLKDRIKDIKLTQKGLTKEDIKELTPKLNIDTLKISGEEEEKTSVTAFAMTGFAGAFLVYFFIFLYGVQVMKSVMEEKSNRIVEVIISSVKPFQLMMGKVLGIAAVSITQFLAWIILSFAATMAVSSAFQLDKFSNNNIKETIMTTPDVEQAMEWHSVVSAVEAVNFSLVIGGFLFFFFGGYLIYAALFAAVGAAVDNETDTQQFMLPITIPMIIAFMVAQGIMSDPESSVAFWFSVIPLTSPVVMMIRIPFGVPAWELALSMTSLVLGFLGAIWLASKIYRVGILMYGKKVNYKELWKWITYKESK